MARILTDAIDGTVSPVDGMGRPKGFAYELFFPTAYVF